MKKHLEICVDMLASAFIAEKMGADRIELCSSLALDGLTPSYGMMKIAARLSIPIYAMIRPRGGNFVYTSQEIEWMLEDIHAVHQAGLDGIVFGCLNEDFSFDKDTMRILQKTAKSKNLPITVHRAFDVVKDPFEALDFLLEMGVQRLLTSGQKPSALEGAELIAQLVKQSQNKISIMAGSGVHPANLAECIQKTKAHEFHFSARKHAKNNIMNEDYIIADPDLISEARHILNKY